jgi:hypothetical protein
MAIQKRPVGANDNLCPKLSSVAGILAQSQNVVKAFGRAAGFILMMTGLFVVLSVNLTTILVLSKGAGVALSPIVNRV